MQRVDSLEEVTFKVKIDKRGVVIDGRNAFRHW